MRFRPLLSLAFIAVSLIAGFAADAQSRKADDKPPTGSEILKLVRMSQATQDLKNLKGKLRISESDQGKEYEGSVYPFDLTMSDNVIRFVFSDPPKETINLNLNEKNTTLTRVTKAGKVEVPAALYGERVRKSAMNYEDLSMRFLYWPNSKVVGAERISSRDTWLVRVPNPDNRGPYRQVDLWVDQASGAMVQLRAYDEQGRTVKQFKVRNVQRYKGAYILKKMRVETYDPAMRTAIGVTYLEIDHPD